MTLFDGIFGGVAFACALLVFRWVVNSSKRERHVPLWFERFRQSVRHPIY